PRSVGNAARAGGPPTGQHGGATSDDGLTPNIAGGTQASVSARGWADSFATDWPYCVPGTVLGYHSRQYKLLPQYLYRGMRPGTRGAFRIYRREASGWKLPHTDPGFAWPAGTPSDGCTVVAMNFDEADPLPDATYLVVPMLDGTEIQAAGQKIVIGGPNTA